MRAGDQALLDVDQAVCAEPGCHGRPVAHGLCRRDYGRRWRQENAAAIAAKRRDRHLAQPLEVLVVDVRVLCPCGGRLVVPAGEVGRVVACVRCARPLRPALVLAEAAELTCWRCGGPLPAGAPVTTRYCSTSCRVLAKEARRPPRVRAATRTMG